MLASGNDARFAREDTGLHAELMALVPDERAAVHSFGHVAAIGARATRLDAAHGLLSRWPESAAHSLSCALDLARTYRLITIAPGDVTACLASGVWRGSHMALRSWRSGDGLMVHVTQVGRLRALAIVTDEPRMVDGPTWQAGFRVIAQLDDGVDTRAVIAPLRRDGSPRWFRGFVGTHHVIKPDDAAALLEAFEAALLAAL